MVVSLDGKQFLSGAEDYSWQYTLRMASTKTLGGKVIQIFGVTMSDLSVTVQFKSPEDQQDWFTKIKSIMNAQTPVIGQRPPTPVRFIWDEQNIDCMVFVKEAVQEGEQTTISATNKNFAPKMNLTLFVEEDNTGLREVAADSAKAAYIARLAAGLGWQQSDWNGPDSTPEFDAAVESNTVLTYLAKLREQRINQMYASDQEEGGATP